MSGNQPTELPVIEENCGSCRYWKPQYSISSFGFCRRRAPIIGELSRETQWPKTENEDTCGEYKSKLPDHKPKELYAIIMRLIGEWKDCEIVGGTMPKKAILTDKDQALLKTVKEAIGDDYKSAIWGESGSDHATDLYEIVMRLTGGAK